MNPLEFDHHKYFYVENLRLYFHNGKYLGDIVQDVDGTYLYFPDLTNAGGWSSFQLLGIGALLFEMNLPFEAEMRSYFGCVRDSGGMGEETPFG